MTNPNYTETGVTIRDSEKLTKKHINWHGYQKCDKNLHHVKLSDTAIITISHGIRFSMMK